MTLDAKKRAASETEVDAFMAALEHPLAPQIRAVRSIILASSSKIEEGIKWNAPSFRTTEYFATFHLRSTKEVQVIFHLGAKKRARIPEMKICAPEGMLRWLAKDRCSVTLGTGDDFKERCAALEKLVREWIAYV